MLILPITRVCFELFSPQHSGLLLTYLTLKQLQKTKGKMNWVLFYVHRFIRITPAYMMAIAIWTTLTFHFGEGPGKIPFFEALASPCRDSGADANASSNLHIILDINA